MNKNVLLVIGVVLVGIIVFGFVMGPLLASGLSADMNIRLYDSDGNPITMPFAFYVNDQPLDKVETKVTWTMTTTGNDVSFLNVECVLTITVRLNTPTSGLVSETIETDAWLGKTTGERTWTHYITELIPNPTDSDKTYGWVVSIKADLIGSGVVDGDIVTATPWTDTVFFKVAWEAGQLVLSGTVGWW